MSTPENDLELLETYLDGALSSTDAVALEHRLSSEADLSAVLVELQTQRGTRAVVWAALEPDDVAVEQLNWRIRGAMADQRRVVRPNIFSPWRIAGIGSAAAACVAFGFFAGWVGRSNHAASVVVTPSAIHQDETVASNTPSSSSSVIPVVKPGTAIMVPVANEYGQVVAWQTFQNASEAKDFTEDLHKANGVVSPGAQDDHEKLMSDEKY